MKTIIAGSRGIADYQIIEDAVTASGFEITQVVSGTARGVDRLGEQWGYKHDVPIARFPADWNMHGKAAGIIRNGTMARYADALIAIWDGQSRGTKNMIDRAVMQQLKIYIYRTDHQ